MKNFEGRLIIFTAPSGAGKTTLVRHLLNTFPEKLSFSVSATTREKREEETEGKDYYFLKSEDFKHRIAQSDFVEWEEVYENQFYGTLQSEIDRLWKEGKHIIFDMDVKGAWKIKNLYKERCLTVFVMPPSLEVLTSRLMNRKSDSAESISRRIAKATKELKWADKFDIQLPNNDLDSAKQKAERIFLDFICK